MALSRIESAPVPVNPSSGDGSIVSPGAHSLLPMDAWRLTDEQLRGLSAEASHLFQGITFADPKLTYDEIVTRFLANIDDDGSPRAASVKRVFEREMRAHPTIFSRELLGSYLAAIDSDVAARMHLASLDQGTYAHLVRIVWDPQTRQFVPFNPNLDVTSVLVSAKRIIQLNSDSLAQESDSEIIHAILHELGHLRNEIGSEFAPVDMAHLSPETLKYTCEFGSDTKPVGHLREFYSESVANSWGMEGDFQRAAQDLSGRPGYGSLEQYLKGSGISADLAANLTPLQRLLFARNLAFLLPITENLPTLDKATFTKIARAWASASPNGQLSADIFRDILSADKGAWDLAMKSGTISPALSKNISDFFQNNLGWPQDFVKDMGAEVLFDLLNDPKKFMAIHSFVVDPKNKEMLGFTLDDIRYSVEPNPGNPAGERKSVVEGLWNQAVGNQSSFVQDPQLQNRVPPRSVPFRRDEARPVDLVDKLKGRLEIIGLQSGEINPSLKSQWLRDFSVRLLEVVQDVGQAKALLLALASDPSIRLVLDVEAKVSDSYWSVENGVKKIVFGGKRVAYDGLSVGLPDFNVLAGHVYLEEIAHATVTGLGTEGRNPSPRESLATTEKAAWDKGYAQVSKDNAVESDLASKLEGRRKAAIEFEAKVRALDGDWKKALDWLAVTYRDSVDLGNLKAELTAIRNADRGVADIELALRGIQYLKNRLNESFVAADLLAARAHEIYLKNTSGPVGTLKRWGRIIKGFVARLAGLKSTTECVVHKAGTCVNPSAVTEDVLDSANSFDRARAAASEDIATAYGSVSPGAAGPKPLENFTVREPGDSNIIILDVDAPVSKSPLEAALKVPLQKTVPPEIATSDKDLISKVRTAMLDASSLNDGQKFSLQHGFDQMERLGLTDAERTNLIQFAKHIASGKPVDIPVQVFGDAGKFAARDIVTRAAFLNWAGAEAGGWKGDRAKFNDLLTRANTIVVHQTTDTPEETAVKAKRVTSTELGSVDKPNRFWDPVISEGRSTFTGTSESKAVVTYFDDSGKAVWSGSVAYDKLGNMPPDNISRITIQSFNDQPALPNLHATMSAAHENAVAGWIGATTPGDLSRVEATENYATSTTASLAGQGGTNSRGIIPVGLEGRYGQPEVHDGFVLPKPEAGSPSGHFVELELVRTPKGFNPDKLFSPTVSFERPQMRFSERAPELEWALKLAALKQTFVKSQVFKVGTGALRSGLAGGSLVLDYAAVDAGLMAYFSGAGGTEIAKQTIAATMEQFVDPTFWQVMGLFSMVGKTAELGIPVISGGAAAAGPIGMTAMVSFGLTTLSLNSAFIYERSPLESQNFLKDALNVYPSLALRASDKMSDIDLSRRLWMARAGLDEDWLKNDPNIQREMERVNEISPGEHLMTALEDFPSLPLTEPAKDFIDEVKFMSQQAYKTAGDLTTNYFFQKAGIDPNNLPYSITASEWIKDLEAQSYVDDVKTMFGISTQTAAEKFENALSRVYAENESRPFIYQNKRGENLQRLAEELMEYPEEQWTAKLDFKRAVNDAVMNGRRQKKGLTGFNHFDLADFLSAESRMMNDNGLPELNPYDPRVAAARLANGPMYYTPPADVIASNLVMNTPFATTAALASEAKKWEEEQHINILRYRNQVGTLYRKAMEISGNDAKKFHDLKVMIDGELERLRQEAIEKRAMAASDPSKLGQVIMQDVATGETTVEALQEFHEEQVATPTNEDWWRMIGYDQSGAAIENANSEQDFLDYEETWDDGLGDELFADAAAGSYDGVTQSAKAGDYFFDPIDPGATIDHGVMECPDYITGGTYFAEHC